MFDMIYLIPGSRFSHVQDILPLGHMLLSLPPSFLPPPIFQEPDTYSKLNHLPILYPPLER